MRIRCSKGLRISAFLGHFFIRSTDLLALPACDADKVGGRGGWGGWWGDGMMACVEWWSGTGPGWVQDVWAGRAQFEQQCGPPHMLFPLLPASCWPLACRTLQLAPPPTHPHAAFPAMSLPSCPPLQSFTVEITHEETILTGQVAYLQAALLYTNSWGERRIRVHTIALPVVSGALTLAGVGHVW